MSKLELLAVKLQPRAWTAAEKSLELTTQTWKEVAPTPGKQFILVDEKGNKEVVRILGGFGEERIVVPKKFGKPSQLLRYARNFRALIRAISAAGFFSWFR